MSTITIPSLSGYFSPEAQPSVLKKFINWSEGQQENRLLWLGLALAGHGCFLTPLTMIVIMAGGLNFLLFSGAIAAMGMALVVNLAALPTKITIPVLAFSALMDIVIIAAALFAIV